MTNPQLGGDARRVSLIRVDLEKNDFWIAQLDQTGQFSRECGRSDDSQIRLPIQLSRDRFSEHSITNLNGDSDATVQRRHTVRHDALCPGGTAGLAACRLGPLNPHGTANAPVRTARSTAITRRGGSAFANYLDAVKTNPEYIRRLDETTLFSRGNGSLHGA
ncbi:MAG TPA: hypothetical protein VFU43_06220 [Streptosporangiaceae bacterium]|nr:hypothetical protein [Streptosporangiaceae bacterium]